MITNEFDIIPNFIAHTSYIRIQNLSDMDKIFYRNILDFTKKLKTYKETCVWAEDGSTWKSAVMNSNVFEHPAAVILYSKSLEDLKADKDFIIKKMKTNFHTEEL